MTKYLYKKENYKIKNISHLQLYFDNGDYVSLKGSEISNISYNLYDRLIKYNDGICPVISSGFIKLKIFNKVKFIYNYSYVYNPLKLKRDRKKYIEERCISESKITRVELYNENNWHITLLGNIKAKIEDSYLILEFLPVESMGDFSDNNSYINLINCKKSDIYKIDLDFENCESFYIYSNEIKKFNINYKQELVWGSSELFRTISDGYIIIKLEDYGRRSLSFCSEDYNSVKDYEKRLCGKKGFIVHDICHLHIYYESSADEYIEIDDIRYSDINEKNHYKNYYFVGGYCKKLKNGTILISFGNNAKETANKFE